jgi:hypothetical protein
MQKEKQEREKFAGYIRMVMMNSLNGFLFTFSHPICLLIQRNKSIVNTVYSQQDGTDKESSFVWPARDFVCVFIMF